MFLPFKRGLYPAVAAAAVAGLIAASAAFAGMLPADGVWRYDNTGGAATNGHAMFTAYLTVNSGQANITAVQGTVIGGKCKQHGRVRPAGLIGFSAIGTKKIHVGADGSFSATRKAVGDATGVKGTVTFKGVFNGKRLGGTVAAHMHNPVFGDCKGSGKFSRATGMPLS